MWVQVQEQLEQGQQAAGQPVPLLQAEASVQQVQQLLACWVLPLVLQELLWQGEYVTTKRHGQAHHH